MTIVPGVTVTRGGRRVFVDQTINVEWDCIVDSGSFADVAVLVKENTPWHMAKS